MTTTHPCLSSRLSYMTTRSFCTPPLYLWRRKKTRRTIFSGTNPMYEETSEQDGRHPADQAADDESWVWVRSADEQPRKARSLNLVPVRDTGCPQDARKMGHWLEGSESDAYEAIILRDEELGDVYRHTGRCAHREQGQIFRSKLGADPTGHRSSLEYRNRTCIRPETTCTHRVRPSHLCRHLR